MADLNTVSIIGRITKDVGSDEYSYMVTPNGTPKATISIANNRPDKKDGKYAERGAFFEVVLWGKAAESLKPHLTKGKQIAVVGSLDYDVWEGKDGQKKSKVYILAQNIQLLGGSEGKGNKKSDKFVPIPQEETPKVDETIPF